MRSHRWFPLLALVLALATPLFSPSTSQAKPGRPSVFGLGLIIGSPTAITGKYWMDHQQAVDVGLSYDFDNSITIYGDYLRHFPNAFSGQRERFIREISPYVGIGGLFHHSDDPWVHNHNHHHHAGDSETNLAVRIPLGLEWLPSDVPLGVHAEIVPAVFIAPEVDAAIMGGIGVRYYFQ